MDYKRILGGKEVYGQGIPGAGPHDFKDCSARAGGKAGDISRGSFDSQGAGCRRISTDAGGGSTLKNSPEKSAANIDGRYSVDLSVIG